MNRGRRLEGLRIVRDQRGGPERRAGVPRVGRVRRVGDAEAGADGAGRDGGEAVALRKVEVVQALAAAGNGAEDALGAVVGPAPDLGEQRVALVVGGAAGEQAVAEAREGALDAAADAAGHARLVDVLAVEVGGLVAHG